MIFRGDSADVFGSAPVARSLPISSIRDYETLSSWGSREFGLWNFIRHRWYGAGTGISSWNAGDYFLAAGERIVDDVVGCVSTQRLAYRGVGHRNHWHGVLSVRHFVGVDRHRFDWGSHRCCQWPTVTITGSSGAGDVVVMVGRRLDRHGLLIL